MTEEQFAKLPRFARLEIETLRANLRSTQNQVARHLGDYNPKFPTYGDYDENRGRSLPCRQVWFRNAGITIRADGDGIYVSADGQLNILPNVSNTITIKSDHIGD